MRASQPGTFAAAAAPATAAAVHWTATLNGDKQAYSCGRPGPDSKSKATPGGSRGTFEDNGVWHGQAHGSGAASVHGY